MENLKQKLLSTNYFLDNDYLAKYVDLCYSCGSNIKTEQHSEAHHILQFSYFTLINRISKKQDINKLRRLSNKVNSLEYNQITKNNLVYLSYYYHCLAHYYLYKCTKGELKYNNEFAFCKMTDRNLQLRGCSGDDIDQLLKNLAQLRLDPDSVSYKNRCIDDAIIQYYGRGGYKLVQSKLLEQGITATKLCLKARAQRLGIKGARYAEDWSDSELEIIKNNYPIGGYNLCKQFLPKRSKFAIQARAKYLGVLAPGASKANAGWTPSEDEILKKYYSIGGTKLCQQYLNRTEKSIKHRANSYLHIFVDKGINKNER